MRTSLRVIAALGLAVGLTASGALATGALADPVTRTPYGPVTTPTLVTDLCPFPVTVTGTQTGYVIDQPLPSGGEQQIFHGTETDVFTANGKTLTGLPYTSTLQLTLDAQGNVTRLTSEGFAELVPCLRAGCSSQPAAPTGCCTRTTSSWPTRTTDASATWRASARRCRDVVDGA